MATVSRSHFTHIHWRIVPLETPRVWRPCAKCGGLQRFASSDHFRLNAQQRKIDVWLIYRCTNCETTWNCAIFTRYTLEKIGPTLYQQLQYNDQETAWRYAFDLHRLQRLGARIDDAIAVRVERSVQAAPSGNPCGQEVQEVQDIQEISVELPYMCPLRLDRLLADEFGVSRSCLQRWLKQGILQIRPEEKNLLRRPVRNGQVIIVGGSKNKA